MTKPEFTFVDRYRTLAPGATREVVEARQKAHAKLYEEGRKSWQKIHTLCGVAFGLEREDPQVTSWLAKNIKEIDEQFVLDLDKAESAKIASLVLEDMITRGVIGVAFAVLTTSYCGRREPGDDGRILAIAKDALEQNGRARQIISDGQSIWASAPGDLKSDIDAMVVALDGPHIRVVAEGILREIKSAQDKLAESATAAFQAVRTENIGLAQELDMLWWNMGNWSDLLEKHRDQLSSDELAISSAIELGGFVPSPPGPYGAYGILRHSLGAQSNAKTTLKKTITAIVGDVAKLNPDVTVGAMPLLPVSAAIMHVAANGATKWSALKQVIGNALTVEVSYFELAVQSYRERVLINQGGF